MTKIDQERVVVFRRILDTKLSDLSDEELLEIMNAAIIPNALSVNAFKYTYLIQKIFNKSKVDKTIKSIDYLVSVLSKVEVELIKFGVLYGFDSFNANYQYHRFISSSLDIGKKNLMKKKISSLFFEKIFVFIYNLIKRGEKNERFPRV